MKLAALFLVLFLVGGGSGCAPKYTGELPLIYIRQIEHVLMQLSIFKAQGLLPDEPSMNWKDRETAYYYALHVAWASQDKEAYKFFHDKLMAIYLELAPDLEYRDKAEKTGL